MSKPISIGTALGEIACRVLNLQDELVAMKARAETAEQERDEAFNEGIEQARNWLRREANALYKLAREPEAKAAFIEAHNAIIKMKRATLEQKG
jgi:lysyl-tRNA synthetase class I